ncbi:enoyl-CoA hydratase-related protein [Marinibaculum pumilum]|uniref:Enoyl-CoA hydratase-related protein n=1 Tax=Marinibaculum pumilum TaxID=1766165 RepID=A0ABV7KUK4_9PROT
MTHISAKRIGAVEMLSIADPDGVANLSARHYEQLTRRIEAAQHDDDIAVFLILGGPGLFCAGADLAQFVAGDEMLDEVSRAAPAFFRALAASDKPFIAAVDGLAAGIGTTMLLHFDLIYASERSLFKAPFVDLGLVPEAASSRLGPERLGYQKAFELFCLGGELTAQEAARLGLVNAVMGAEEVVPAAMEAAHQLARKPAAALRATRRLMRGNPASLAVQIDRECDAFRERLEDAGTRRRLKAFVRIGQARQRSDRNRETAKRTEEVAA